MRKTMIALVSVALVAVLAQGATAYHYSHGYDYGSYYDGYRQGWYDSGYHGYSYYDRPYRNWYSYDYPRYRSVSYTYYYGPYW